VLSSALFVGGLSSGKWRKCIKRAIIAHLFSSVKTSQIVVFLAQIGAI